MLALFATFCITPQTEVLKDGTLVSSGQKPVICKQQRRLHYADVPTGDAHVCLHKHTQPGFCSLPINILTTIQTPVQGIEKTQRE